MTLSKGNFVLEHTGLNIRDEYLIGKVIGAGMICYLTMDLQVRLARLEYVQTGRLGLSGRSK